MEQLQAVTRPQRDLQSHGIEVFDLNDINGMDLYVDGADEITEHMHMLKGGGGALTREKIVAANAKEFICICDESKYVPTLRKISTTCRSFTNGKKLCCQRT